MLKNGALPQCLCLFFAFLLFLGFLVDGNLIVADGCQNLSAAKNIVEHSIFSSVEISGSSPTPDVPVIRHDYF